MGGWGGGVLINHSSHHSSLAYGWLHMNVAKLASNFVCLCGKLVLQIMSYRKAHRAPPKPLADRQDLKAPPPTPPEFDPQSREPTDNTIGEFTDHPMLTRWLLMFCVRFLGVPPQSRPSPKWDSLPMLPARVKRIVYMYCWGPPDEVACAVYLTAGYDTGELRGRQEWSFYNHHHANYRLHKFPYPRRDRAHDVDDDEESFAGTEDGFEY